MEHRIREIITDRINPLLFEHYGGAELVDIKDNVVYVRMLGSCGACPSSQTTLETIIETIIKEELPEIKRVTIYQGVSDEMINFAKDIVKKEKSEQNRL